MKVWPSIVGKSLIDCKPGEVFRFDSYDSAPLATVIGRTAESSGKLVVFFESFDAKQPAHYWDYFPEPADFRVASFGENCVVVPTQISQDWCGKSWAQNPSPGILTISEAGVCLMATPAINRRGGALYWNIEDGMLAENIAAAQAERASIAAVHWKICAPKTATISGTDQYGIIFEHRLHGDKKA